MSFTNATQFQGAVYADGTTNVCARNNTKLQGPSVANLQDFDNSIDYRPLPTSGVVNGAVRRPGADHAGQRLRRDVADQLRRLA